MNDAKATDITEVLRSALTAERDRALSSLEVLYDWLSRGDGEEPQNMDRYRKDLQRAAAVLHDAGLA